MYLPYKLLLLLFLNIFTAESADPVAYSCNTNSQTNGSTQISSNIDTVLPTLVSGTTRNRFIRTSYGNKKDRVFGLAQCRGDVRQNDCSNCIKDAAKSIRKLCPNRADARIWYDYCFLRYSTEKLIGGDDGSGVFLYNVENVEDADVLNQKLGVLTDQIESEAVKRSNKGLGKGKRKISPFITLYASVQRTRDLPSLNCAQCLALAVGNFPGICAEKIRCRVSLSNCYVRYELYDCYPFFPVDAQEKTLVLSSGKYERVKAFES